MIIPFVTRYKDIRKDADFIVVFGGTNDYGFNTPLGTEEDTSDISFYGALYEMLTGLKKDHPDAAIVFMTPLHRVGFGGVDYDRQRNDAGYSLYHFKYFADSSCFVFNSPEEYTAEVVIEIFHFFICNSVNPVFKIEIKTVIFGTVHYSQI